MSSHPMAGGGGGGSSNETLDLILLLSSALGVTLLQFVSKQVVNGTEALKIHLLFGCIVSALLAFQTQHLYVARYMVSVFGVPAAITLMERLASLTQSFTTAAATQEKSGGTVGSNAHIYAAAAHPPPPPQTRSASDNVQQHYAHGPEEAI